MERKCVICGIDISELAKNRKTCSSKCSYENSKIKVKEAKLRRREYYLNYQREYNKKYEKRNKEVRSKYWRDYYQRNREAIKKKNIERYNKHREIINER